MQSEALKNPFRGRRRSGRRKGEQPPPLHLAPIGLMRLFETDDIEVAIRRLDELGIWAQVTRGATRTWASCAVDDLPEDLRVRAAEIAIDERLRNTTLGRLNDDGTFSSSEE